MKKNNSFALLSVLLVSSFITLFTLDWWRRSSMIYDIVVSREKYYKNFYLTDLVLHYGIKLSKQYFDDFENKKVNLDLSFICKRVEVQHKAILSVSPKSNSILLCASLYDGDSIIFKISCILKKLYCNDSKKCNYYIKDYTIGTIV